MLIFVVVVLKMKFSFYHALILPCRLWWFTIWYLSIYFILFKHMNSSSNLKNKFIYWIENLVLRIIFTFFINFLSKKYLGVLGFNFFIFFFKLINEILFIIWHFLLSLMIISLLLIKFCSLRKEFSILKFWSSIRVMWINESYELQRLTFLVVSHELHVWTNIFTVCRSMICYIRFENWTHNILIFSTFNSLIF